MFPKAVHERKPGLIPDHFIIPAGTEANPAIVHLKDAKFNVYMDSDRGSFPVPVPALDLAQSIVFDFNSALLEYQEDSHPAIIALPGILTATEIKNKHGVIYKTALEAQRTWYLRLVMLADDDWSKNRRHMTISEIQRLAAKELGLEREWLTIVAEVPNSPLATKQCPACFSIVAPEAIVCSVCRCVIDKKAAANFDFVK